MNLDYQGYKAWYDELGHEISKLQERRREVRDLMEKVCPHENVAAIESDPFLVAIEVEDDETKYKCQDCFAYFRRGGSERD